MKSLMHSNRFVDILPCVTCLSISHPTFKSLKFNEIQLHISCKQVKMSYILGGGNVYTWHHHMCYSRPYIYCKVVVD
jgi:hypothetical protein